MISISKTVGKHSVVMKFDRRKIGLVNIYHSTHNTGYLVETARLREHVVESGHLRTAEVTGTISYCSTDRKYTMPLESGMRNGEKSSEKNTMSPRRQYGAPTTKVHDKGQLRLSTIDSLIRRPRWGSNKLSVSLFIGDANVKTSYFCHHYKSEILVV